ncbi:hypothetical protein [Aeromicrobium sp. Leaf291]|uniref:hypothetical protein n=1 Tax=Aeromicrobium sp. Leaf291 TaxID=1736325 RepID=UPI0006F6F080|nr:hypothetical protein [Aeromicrobium sp. Leaf291]KQP81583.1 hypothetical protein ASF35_16260 [Aeromicrobium sp. Leaf291]
MGRIKGFILDAWSAVDYKAPLRDEVEARQKGWEARSWVPSRDRRRLAAYTVLAAYRANNARAFLGGTDEDRDDNREYGDAALIIDQTLAALLGETQELVVPGAERAAALQAEVDALDADLAQRPEDEDADLDLLERDDLLLELAAAQRLADRQAFLRAWAEDVHLPLRLVDGEGNAVQSGDAVYLIGWDGNRERATCSVIDPGFYFPVLPDSIDAYAYPETVHFAWELPAEDFPLDKKTRLRRLTYRLGPIRPAEVLEDGDEVEYVLHEGDRVNDEGLIERTYPWDGKPSTRTCHVTDATWILDDIRGDTDVRALTLDTATFAVSDEGELVRDLDLHVDFLPVVHVPNTPAGGNHYGQSSIAAVLQILDDLQNADTDAQRASATAGSPIIGVSGAKIGGEANGRGGGVGRQLTVKAGEVWDLGENGALSTVNTAAALAELRDYVESLRDRAHVNSRLPAAVTGTMDPSDAPSGYAMQLSFGPLTSMIRQMRLTRSVKHPLILKMVQRFYQTNGLLEAGETPRAEIRLGSFLPADQAGVLSLVKDALEAGAISLETGVAMLVDVGFPVDDIAEEIRRIESRDFKGANDLADAIGNIDAVLAYLGREATTEELQRPVVLGGAPPVPPVPTQDA